MDTNNHEIGTLIQQGESLSIEFKSDLKCLPDRELVADVRATPERLAETGFLESQGAERGRTSSLSSRKSATTKGLSLNGLEPICSYLCSVSVNMLAKHKLYAQRIYIRYFLRQHEKTFANPPVKCKNIHFGQPYDHIRLESKVIREGERIQI
jgi:hypothetical protein